MVDPSAADPPTFAELLSRICHNVGRVVRGKDDVVHLAVMCMIAEGHLLVEDVPGVGKTSLAKALARSVRGEFRRIQFTPDLLPADVLGTAVWNRRDATFEFRPGPIFANVLLADEINRASPKTQSALLEAMAEEQVTVDGTTHPLARPFMVVATQNPIEHQGTYPLPEAQLDRFLMRVAVGYPSRDDELQVLAGDGGDPALSGLAPVVDSEVVRAMSRHAERVHVSPAVAGYLLDLTAATRQHRQLSLGMSPRAALGVQRVARVRAAAAGRTYVTPDDVRALLVPVVAHRLLLAPEAQIQGVTAGDVLADVVRSVPVPVDSPVS